MKSLRTMRLRTRQSLTSKSFLVSSIAEDDLRTFLAKKVNRIFTRRSSVKQKMVNLNWDYGNPINITERVNCSKNFYKFWDCLKFAFLYKVDTLNQKGQLDMTVMLKLKKNVFINNVLKPLKSRNTKNSCLEYLCLERKPLPFSFQPNRSHKSNCSQTNCSSSSMQKLTVFQL